MSVEITIPIARCQQPIQRQPEDFNNGFQYFNLLGQDELVQPERHINPCFHHA
jgi:hypothetical protein